MEHTEGNNEQNPYVMVPGYIMLYVPSNQHHIPMEVRANIPAYVPEVSDIPYQDDKASDFSTYLGETRDGSAYEARSFPTYFSETSNHHSFDPEVSENLEQGNETSAELTYVTKSPEDPDYVTEVFDGVEYVTKTSEKLPFTTKASDHSNYIGEVFEGIEYAPKALECAGYVTEPPEELTYITEALENSAYGVDTSSNLAYTPKASDEVSCNAENLKVASFVSKTSNSSALVTESPNDSAHIAEVFKNPANIAESLNCPTYITEASNDPAYLSESTNSPPYVAEAANNSAYMAEAINNPPYVAEAANNLPYMAEATNNPPYVAEATNGPAYITEAPNNSIYMTEATNNLTYNAQVPHDPVYMTEATNDPAYVTDVSNDPVHMTEATNNPSYNTHIPNGPAYNPQVPNDSVYITEATNYPAYSAQVPSDPAFNTQVPNDSVYMTEAPNDPTYVAEASNDTAFTAEVPNDSVYMTEATNNSAYNTQVPNDSVYMTEANSDPTYIPESPNNLTYLAETPDVCTYVTEVPNIPAYIAASSDNLGYVTETSDVPTYVADTPNVPAYFATTSNGLAYVLKTPLNSTYVTEVSDIPTYAPEVSSDSTQVTEPSQVPDCVSKASDVSPYEPETSDQDNYVPKLYTYLTNVPSDVLAHDPNVPKWTSVEDNTFLLSQSPSDCAASEYRNTDNSVVTPNTNSATVTQDTGVKNSSNADVEPEVLPSIRRTVKSKIEGSVKIKTSGGDIEKISVPTRKTLSLLRESSFIQKLVINLKKKCSYAKSLSVAVDDVVYTGLLIDWLLLKCEATSKKFDTLEGEVVIHSVKSFEELTSVVYNNSCLPLSVVINNGTSCYQYFYLVFNYGDNPKLTKINDWVFQEEKKPENKIEEGLEISNKFDKSVNYFNFETQRGTDKFVKANLPAITRLIFRHIIWGFFQIWVRTVVKLNKCKIPVKDVAKQLVLCFVASNVEEFKNFALKNQTIYLIGFFRSYLVYIQYIPSNLIKKKEFSVRMENVETELVSNIPLIQYYRQFFFLNQPNQTSQLKSVAEVLGSESTAFQPRSAYSRYSHIRRKRNNDVNRNSTISNSFPEGNLLNEIISGDVIGEIPHQVLYKLVIHMLNKGQVTPKYVKSKFLLLLRVSLSTCYSSYFGVDKKEDDAIDETFMKNCFTVAVVYAKDSASFSHFLKEILKSLQCHFTNATCRKIMDRMLLEELKKSHNYHVEQQAKQKAKKRMKMAHLLLKMQKSNISNKRQEINIVDEDSLSAIEDTDSNSSLDSGTQDDSTTTDDSSDHDETNSNLLQSSQELEKNTVVNNSVISKEINKNPCVSETQNDFVAENNSSVNEEKETNLKMPQTQESSPATVHLPENVDNPPRLPQPVRNTTVIKYIPLNHESDSRSLCVPQTVKDNSPKNYFPEQLDDDEEPLCVYQALKRNSDMDYATLETKKYIKPSNLCESPEVNLTTNDNTDTKLFESEYTEMNIKVDNSPENNKYNIKPCDSENVEINIAISEEKDMNPNESESMKINISVDDSCPYNEKTSNECETQSLEINIATDDSAVNMETDELLVDDRKSTNFLDVFQTEENRNSFLRREKVTDPFNPQDVEIVGETIESFIKNEKDTKVSCGFQTPGSITANGNSSVEPEDVKPYESQTLEISVTTNDSPVHNEKESLTLKINVSTEDSSDQTDTAPYCISKTVDGSTALDVSTVVLPKDTQSSSSAQTLEICVATNDLRENNEKSNNSSETLRINVTDNSYTNPSGLPLALLGTSSVIRKNDKYASDVSETLEINVATEYPPVKPERDNDSHRHTSDDSVGENFLQVKEDTKYCKPKSVPEYNQPLKLKKDIKSFYTSPKLKKPMFLPKVDLVQEYLCYMRQPAIHLPKVENVICFDSFLTNYRSIHKLKIKYHPRDLKFIVSIKRQFQVQNENVPRGVIDETENVEKVAVSCKTLELLYRWRRIFLKRTKKQIPVNSVNDIKINQGKF